jgi:uncharacterized protein (DUF2235 family)
MMSRNLVICCDGTNNQFGPENTSVVRLAQMLNRDATKQRFYYDPGIGTLPQPGVLTRLGKKLSEWIELAFGVGLVGKVEGAYSYLMDTWEPGDRVFLFGFSRGAYTVRVLAGALHSLGLLPRGSHNLVPYVMRLFKAVRKEGTSHAERKQGTGHAEDEASGYWRLCDAFRWTFARPVPGHHDRRFAIHFLGVWDTVSSVGWVWDPAKFPYTARNPGIYVIRHAVSVDERRWFFRQNLMQQTGDQDFQEQWFPGVHGDVGGGYPDTVKDGGLWRIPCQWILDEAQTAGLLIDSERLQEVLHKTPHSPRPWTDPQHESLTPLWWPAEFFPKLQWQRGRSLRLPRLGLGRHRYIEDHAMIHRSTLLRIRETGYAPPNLSQAFLAKVRALLNVPDALAYER